MSLTRGSVLSSAEAEIKGGQAINTTLANKWFNELEREIKRVFNSIDPLRTFTETTFIVSSSSNTYTLPSDFGDISAFELGFFKQDQNGKDSLRYMETSKDSGSEGFYFSGNIAYFEGLGTENTTIKCRYTPSYTPKTIWASSDTIIIPDDYEEMAVRYIIAKFYHSELEYQLEGVELARYDSLLTELKNQYRRTPKTIFRINSL